MLRCLGCANIDDAWPHRAFFEPGEDHWHSSAPTRFMTHLAMLKVDEQGTNATWGEHVIDEEYAAAPPLVSDTA